MGYYNENVMERYCDRYGINIGFTVEDYEHGACLICNNPAKDGEDYCVDCLFDKQEIQ